MTRARNSKGFRQMTRRELEAATKEFDREFVIDSFGPMSPKGRTLWDRAKRKVGRPRRGRGAKVVSVSIERDLLARADALASRMGLSRAGLIEKGLRAALIVEGEQ